jgi:hypothetical protein
MSNIMKGLQTENNDFQVNVPGYGTMPLEMLKNHVKELTKDFNEMVQSEEFIKAAYRTEQLYNALFALSKAMKAKSKELDETHSTGTTVGSAGIGGGAGLGIEKSPIEKVIEKPLGETIQSSQGGMGQSYRKFTPKSAGVAEGAPELLKKEMPTHRHAEKLLAQNGVNKDDPDYHKHLANTIKHLRKFGNIDLINKQDVDEEQAPMFTPEEKLNELSPETLARYKKAAGADATKADSEGDFERGNKRFSGIVRATKKEFDNDAKSAKKESSIMKGLQTEGSVITWSKDNPPPPQLLLNTLIQILMKPENQKTPQDLISLWNEKYGLKHTLNSLRQYAQNDYKKMELSKALQKAALANESSKGK